MVSEQTKYGDENRDYSQKSAYLNISINEQNYTIINSKTRITLEGRAMEGDYI